MEIESDAEVSRILDLEKRRQRENLELIPSENYVSESVLAAMGSVLTNKYAEGYPEKRYYGGNKFIDLAENLAIRRAQELFKTDYHLNVQPYSGSPANLAVYLALLEFKDKILGMNLSHGGHLTHGHPVSFSGIAYKVVQYGVNRKSEQIDYEEVQKIAKREKPKLIVCGATAYPRIIDFKKFGQISRGIGAYLLADISHIAGLIATDLHPSPFGIADVVMTTTHKTLRGPRGAIIFCQKNLAEKIDKAVFPGLQGGPHEHIIMAEAVAFGEALKPTFKKYQMQMIENARTLADTLKAGGLRLVSGGTDNHLILVDLSPLGMSGKEAEKNLDQAKITVNKNTIPFDKRPPSDPSGIRLGTPAVTSRGMKEKEMIKIGALIIQALKAKTEIEVRKVKKEVLELTKRFPVPGIDK